jgi:uncharacterized phage protein gp47/JayE
MPFVIPTLPDLRRQSRDFIVSKLPGSEVAPPNSRLRVIGDKNAAGAYLNLLYLLWVSQQLMPDTAETEWLDRHANIWLNGRKAATYASGTINVTGTNGTVLPSGTRLAGNGAEYQTTAQITVGTVATPVAVVALTAGAVGNQAADTPLQFTDAVPGIDGGAVVVLLAGGADTENDEDLRARVLDRIRQPPMGGDKNDYVQWALSVPGVTRAWCAPLEMGIGTVTVRFMMDDLRAPTGGFPTVDDVAAVRAYLDTVRPVAVKDFFVSAPIASPINFTISSLTTDNAAVRAAIEASVRKMLLGRAIPGQTIFRSWVDEAISVATGETSHELTFVTTAMASPGHMATFGTISYA